MKDEAIIVQEGTRGRHEGSHDSGDAIMIGRRLCHLSYTSHAILSVCLSPSHSARLPLQSVLTLLVCHGYSLIYNDCLPFALLIFMCRFVLCYF